MTSFFSFVKTALQNGLRGLNVSMVSAQGHVTVSAVSLTALSSLKPSRSRVSRWVSFIRNLSNNMSLLIVNASYSIYKY